eukprot:TRINITY_DN6033_c1_g1_i1.p2 TRINITY_DN6033_c1_g1~~TRINITY_DN6033_c1_g1_i1.p2  ORF type:complete len:217 (-),score=-9.77 TRINITY_DN6033_c1_g1_i1:269-919(-)
MHTMQLSYYGVVQEVYQHIHTHSTLNIYRLFFRCQIRRLVQLVNDMVNVCLIILHMHALLSQYLFMASILVTFLNVINALFLRIIHIMSSVKIAQQLRCMYACICDYVEKCIFTTHVGRQGCYKTRTIKKWFQPVSRFISFMTFPQQIRFDHYFVDMFVINNRRGFYLWVQLGIFGSIQQFGRGLAIFFNSEVGLSLKYSIICIYMYFSRSSKYFF